MMTGLDIKTSPFTNHVGSIIIVFKQCMQGGSGPPRRRAHKPIATHSHQVHRYQSPGTLILLEEAVGGSRRLSSRVRPAYSAAPYRRVEHRRVDRRGRHAHSQEHLRNPKLAENLCELFHHQCNLPCIVLRTRDSSQRKTTTGFLAEIPG